MRFLIAVATLVASVSVSANSASENIAEAGSKASRLESAIEGYHASGEFDRGHSYWMGFSMALAEDEDFDVEEVVTSASKYVVQFICFQYVPD